LSLEREKHHLSNSERIPYEAKIAQRAGATSSTAQGRREAEREGRFEQGRGHTGEGVVPPPFLVSSFSPSSRSRRGMGASLTALAASRVAGVAVEL
jgi:hypothetical protein